MNNSFILPLDDKDATLENVGGKGASLSRMANAGFPIPGGYYVTTDAYNRFVHQNNLQEHIRKALETIEINKPDTLDIASENIRGLFKNTSIPSEIASTVTDAYSSLPGSCPAVAVRSSATAEDLPDASFAGQQETFLNVQGADALLGAVRGCWASLWTARAISYRARQGIDSNHISLAVIVQLLVPAQAAGIMFTANPINNHRDQAVINASWGLGEAVVGGQVTPDTLILDKTSNKVIARETQEKIVQTVRVPGGTQEESVPEHLRRAPVLSDKQAIALLQLGKQIESLYNMPMDIEWVLENETFSILQARPITALSDPEMPGPTEWKLPQGAYAVMRNNIVELMVEPLSPLFKTLGLRAVNTSLDRLMANFLGDIDLLPEGPIIAVNEYAYYNGSVRFGPILRVTLDFPNIMKRMFTGAVEHWTEIGRPQYIATVQAWEEQDWQNLSTTGLIQAAYELTCAAINAYGALVSGVIPAAWITEALFTAFYNLLVKKKSDPKAYVYLLGFESLPIRAEKELYDLAESARCNQDLSAYLTSIRAEQLVADLFNTAPPAQVDPVSWQTWQEGIQAYLHKYGHTIYNLDFVNPVPADDPVPVLETFQMFLQGQGTNPHERQRASEKKREQAVAAMEERLRGVRLKLFNKTLALAQRYAPLREDGIAEVGLSYPLLRQILKEIGTRFMTAGLVQEAADVYWLSEEQLTQAAEKLDSGALPDDLSEQVAKYKKVWQTARKANPPMMLPQIKMFGLDIGEIKSGGFRRAKNTLKGVAASPGRVTATARVIAGPEDFGKLQQGDALVAAITTPAWTPLFARASAVVTDIGGPLSHGSIVAREYGIPAVLGTGSATRRIQSGQAIIVDGSDGVVTLLGN